MKKTELNKLDKLNESKKLTQELKEKITKKIFNNFIIAINILVLIAFLIVIKRFFNKDEILLIYKITSLVFLAFTFVLFELAYKKDDDTLAIHSIEICVLSVIILLLQYIFFEKLSEITILLGVYFSLYYTIKNIVIYYKEESNYKKQISDIKEIVKKESKDKLLEENKKVKQKNAGNGSKPFHKQEQKATQKRGRPKKDVGKDPKPFREEEQKVAKKRGRPKKITEDNKIKV